MCGIIGYIGRSPAKPILLDALQALEYRGYDSCGIALREGQSITTFKDALRVSALKVSCPPMEGTMGIGHTRWATHGAPSQRNAHPHGDCSGRLVVVHNGIITNFYALRERLSAEGHRFLSETDSEVIPHLIELYYRGDLEEAVQKAIERLEGSYAVVVLSADEERLVAARKDSPLVIGVGDGEMFVASDVPAILGYTDRVVYLEDRDVAVITRDGVRIRQRGMEIHREEHRIQWTMGDVQKAGYEHFMLKEIHEQPRIMRDLLGSYSLYERPSSVFREAGIETVTIVGCGTSYHAGLIGKYVMEELLGVPVSVDLASELNHGRRTIPPSLAIAISQSGETADVLAALRRFRDMAVRTIAITNVPGSSASRIAGETFYTRAGPEISVAATKSFIAQLVTLYQFAIASARIPLSAKDGLMAELRQMPEKVEQLLADEDRIAECAALVAEYEHVFFMARGINYPVALEGALKLKEISYIHAEGYAAGELKHGSIALLWEDTPVIALAPRDSTYDAMVSNIKQTKARGAPVIAVADGADEQMEALADRVIRVPGTHPLCTPLLNAVVVQLLAYHAARVRGCPVDFPRHLAKSVTVE